MISNIGAKNVKNGKTITRINKKSLLLTIFLIILALNIGISYKSYYFIEVRQLRSDSIYNNNDEVSVAFKQLKAVDRVISTDLIINYEEIFANENIEAQANIIVTNGGKLIINNSFVNFVCSRSGEFSLKVEAGGTLEIVDNSLIQSASNYIRSAIIINKFSNFKAINSTFYYLGYNSYFFEDKFYSSSPALAIHGAGSTIEFCEFINCINAVYFGESVTSGVIEESEFRSNEHYAIFVNNSQNLLLINLKISFGSYYGIFAGYGANNITINYSDIRYNYFGCFLKECSDSLIQNNSINGNYYNIYASESHNIRIKDNSILYSQYYGVYIADTTFSSVESNSISNSPIFSIIMRNSSNTIIRSNNIWESETAIRFDDNEGKSINNYNNITMNFIWHVEFGIIIDRLSEGNTIWFNSLSDIEAIFASDESSYNKWDNGSIGNYWGSDYSGKDENGDFIGDSPYISDLLIDNYPLVISHELFLEYLTNPPDKNTGDSLLVFEIIVALILPIFIINFVKKNK